MNEEMLKLFSFARDNGIGQMTDENLVKIMTVGASTNSHIRPSIQDMTMNGVSEDLATQIMSTIEFYKRSAEGKKKKKIKVSHSRSVYEYLRQDLEDLPQEKFFALFLDRNNQIIGKKELFSGGVSATIIDPRIVFKEAINLLASGIIFAHNHPSGNLTPSQADIHITHKLKEGGKVFDMKVLDHLIISSNGYYSFADEGNMG